MNRLFSFSHAVLRRLTVVLALFVCAVMAFPSNLAAQDLAALPEYKPQQKLSGVLRSWGNNHMATLMKYWEEGFRKYHPEISFEDNLKGSATGMLGLEELVADIALMGRQITPYDTYG